MRVSSVLIVVVRMGARRSAHLIARAGVVVTRAVLGARTVVTWTVLRTGGEEVAAGLELVALLTTEATAFAVVATALTVLLFITVSGSAAAVTRVVTVSVRWRATITVVVIATVITMEVTAAEAGVVLTVVAAIATVRELKVTLAAEALLVTRDVDSVLVTGIDPNGDGNHLRFFNELLGAASVLGELEFFGDSTGVAAVPLRTVSALFTGPLSSARWIESSGLGVVKAALQLGWVVGCREGSFITRLFTDRNVGGVDVVEDLGSEARELLHDR